MDKKKKNCIFISANKSFLELLKICLSSISQNYPNHPDIVLCHTDFTNTDLQELSAIASRIIPIQNTLAPFEIWPIMSHLPNDTDPKTFYARFLIRKWWIFEGYENVLHLDADTLVLKDLDALMDRDDFYVVKEAYTGDDKIFKLHSDPDLLKQLDQDDIVIWDMAINGGVFLVPREYRKKKYYDELISLLSSYRPYIQRADQSILNIRMYKNHLPIQTQFDYNFQHRLVENPVYDSLISDAHILHFNGVDNKHRKLCMEKFLDIYTTDNDIQQYRAYYNLHK